MNNKTKAVAGAGAGLLALSMIGGGTFAAWSDFATVEGNVATAGELVLDAQGAGTETEDVGPLAPGENKTIYRYVANRSDNTTALQDALLEISILNVADMDNGCSSDGEAAAEQGSEAGLGGGNPDDAICNNGGELSEQVWLQMGSKPASADVDTPEDCENAGISGTNFREAKTLAAWGTSDAKSLGTLDPQQGLCIVFELGLPNGQGGDTDAPGIDFAGDADSTNASQGDSATFDVRLDLTQQVG